MDYLYDGGSYRGELALFSLEGLEAFAPGSCDFIQEVARRASSDSYLGYVVIHDATEAARFSGVLPKDKDFNQGTYIGKKTVQMTPGTRFGVMLVPNGTVQEVLRQPTLTRAKRPLFSLETANPNQAFAIGQIGDVTGAGHTFALEDLRADGKTDRDYNDVVFQLSGATGQAALLDDLIHPHKDWRTSELGQQLIEYVEASEATPQARQPLVGIIDTGFAANHPDLNYDNIALGKDYLDGDTNPLLQPGEGNSHGTHIWGIIAATQNNGIGIDGINDQAPIWLSRATGSGRWAEALIEFVDAAKASGQPNAVVNLSFDLVELHPNGSVSPRSFLTLQERLAIAYAQQHGVLIVAAAGNTPGMLSVLGRAAAEFDNILTVGASSYDGRAPYSGTGLALDLVAPGRLSDHSTASTLSSDIGTIAGTSVATAQVTGAVSQVWATNPQLSYQQVIDILKATATNLLTPGWDSETGAGLLNRDAAVEVARFTTPTPTERQLSNSIARPQFPTSSRVEEIASERPAEYYGTYTFTGDYYGDGTSTLNYTQTETESKGEGGSSFEKQYSGSGTVKRQWQMQAHGERSFDEQWNHESQTQIQSRYQDEGFSQTSNSKSSSEEQGTAHHDDHPTGDTGTSERFSYSTSEDNTETAQSGDLTIQSSSKAFSNNYRYTQREYKPGFEQTTYDYDEYSKHSSQEKSEYSHAGISNLYKKETELEEQKYTNLTDDSINALRFGTEDSFITSSSNTASFNRDITSEPETVNAGSKSTRAQRHTQTIYEGKTWKVIDDLNENSYWHQYTHETYDNGLRYTASHARSKDYQLQSQYDHEGRSESIAKQQDSDYTYEEYDYGNGKKTLRTRHKYSIAESGVDASGQPWSRSQEWIWTHSRFIEDGVARWTKSWNQKTWNDDVVQERSGSISGIVTTDGNGSAAPPNPPDFQDISAPDLLGSGLSLALDLTPGVGEIKGVVEALTGHDLVTGEPLAPWERLIGILPGISDVGKLVSKAGDIAKAVEGASDATKAAAAAADLAKAQKAAQAANEAADRLDDIVPGSPEAIRARDLAEEAIDQAAQAARGPIVRPYQNLFPEDVPTAVTRHELFFDGNKWRYRTPGGQVYTPNGEYNFITQGDKIYIARERLGRGQHINISRGEDVDFAGQIRFGHGTNSRGQVQYWNNASGHYKPTPESAGNANLPLESFKPYNFLQ